MKHLPTRLALPAVAVVAAAALTAPADADLFFYEDFTGLTAGGAGLNGQGGWTSPGGDMQVQNTTFTDGSSGSWNGTITGSTTSGGNFITPATGGAHAFADIALDSFVTNSFAAGTTTWLSYVEYNGNGGNVGLQNLAIGAAPLTGDGGVEMAGEGIGVGTTNNNTPRATYWQPNALGDDENADATSSISSGRPIFVVAKIQWSDTGNDTITVKRFAFSIPGGLNEAAWNAEAGVSTNSADLDQSTFDTLSIASRYAWFDEIRIANDFDSAVTGTTVVPEPGTLALMGLGGLCLARRRRG
jgi:hypothetical protein